MPMEGREVEGGGSGRPGGLPWLLVKGDRLCSGVSSSFFFIIIINFLREGRRVCKACASAKWRCTTLEGDTIKVSQKKIEDVEEGSSSGKKQKREEEDEIEAEFGLVVEELWRRVVLKWEESE